MSTVSFLGFNKNFFGTRDISWFSKKGVHKINETRNATIEVVTRSTSGQYEGYLVRIVDKDGGEIDKLYFSFNEYLKGRGDRRPDYNAGFKIITHICEKTGEADWYIAKPIYSERVKMAQTIFNYIDTWR
jgi:hypothetical protein